MESVEGVLEDYIQDFLRGLRYLRRSMRGTGEFVVIQSKPYGRVCDLRNELHNGQYGRSEFEIQRRPQMTYEWKAKGSRSAGTSIISPDLMPPDPYVDIP